MKPITKRLLQAGLIDNKFASMLEYWGALDPEEVEHQKAITNLVNTKKDLLQLVDDLDEILGTKETEGIKETRFEIYTRKPPVNLFTPSRGMFAAIQDELGRYIIGPNITLTPGDFLWAPGDDGKGPSLRVVEITPLYENDKVVAKQITVESNKWGS